MSAFAYIEKFDVPRPLMDTAAHRQEGINSLIAFIGCPMTACIVMDDDGRQEIQFPFPRSPDLRDQLVAWLCHWGLSFRVEM
jgi:hypothetical protein